MSKIIDYLETKRQHHHANRLRAAAVKEYADDPDVVIHSHAVGRVDAPHGVNTPKEMTYSADSVTD